MSEEAGLTFTDWQGAITHLAWWWTLEEIGQRLEVRAETVSRWLHRRAAPLWRYRRKLIRWASEELALERWSPGPALEMVGKFFNVVEIAQVVDAHPNSVTRWLGGDRPSQPSCRRLDRWAQAVALGKCLTLAEAEALCADA